MRRLYIASLAVAASFVPSLAGAQAPRFHSKSTAVNEARKFVGHEGEVLDAVFLPDGGLATAGADGTVRLWDYATGKERQTIVRQSEPITRLTLNQQRGELLSFSADGTITAWQLPRPGRPWGPEQATGAPDSSTGDQQTAWASATQDDQLEWLMVEYDKPIKATEIRVFETFNPGAISRITAFTPEGKEFDAWTAEAAVGKKLGKDAGSALGSPRPLQLDFPVERIKLYIDSPDVAGWNEIDAVGLVDESGETHWAKSAAASSTYAEQRDGRWRVDPSLLLPIPPTFEIPAGSVEVTNVDDTAEGKQSYGGTGFAEQFERPADAKYVAAIELFGSRYGMPQPPDEDFKVYLLDGDNRVIKELAFPYAMFDRGNERWVTLGLDDVEVPEKFGVAVDFNAHQSKGVYLGKDESVAKSHSFVGTPKAGFKSVEGEHDWMIRVHLVKKPRTAKPKAYDKI